MQANPIEMKLIENQVLDCHPVPVGLCCNHGENGMFAGRCWGVDIGGNMTFHCYNTAGVKLSIEDDSIRFSGKKFPIGGHKSWVGNWCWDQVLIPGAHVIELLNWSKFKTLFSLETAEHRLFNTWNKGLRFQGDDIRLICKA